MPFVDKQFVIIRKEMDPMKTYISILWLVTLTSICLAIWAIYEIDNAHAMCHALTKSVQFVS